MAVHLGGAWQDKALLCQTCCRWLPEDVTDPDGCLPMTAYLMTCILSLSVWQLEYIGGEIWANIWQTECIARICPDTGKVRAWLLLHDLRAKLQQRNLATTPMDVLNGEQTVTTAASAAL